MDDINVPIWSLDGNAFIPKKATKGSSGYDLRTTCCLTIHPGKSVILPTGIHVAIPRNYELQIRPRSGLAFKHQITVLNTPGTIDSDYRGEIKVILINHGSEKVTIKLGERIAQAVLCPIYAINWVPLTKDQYSTLESDRGQGGFGSTGK